MKEKILELLAPLKGAILKKRWNFISTIALICVGIILIAVGFGLGFLSPSNAEFYLYAIGVVLIIVGSIYFKRAKDELLVIAKSYEDDGKLAEAIYKTYFEEKDSINEVISVNWFENKDGWDCQELTINSGGTKYLVATEKKSANIATVDDVAPGIGAVVAKMGLGYIGAGIASNSRSIKYTYLMNYRVTKFSDSAEIPSKELIAMFYQSVNPLKKSDFVSESIDFNKNFAVKGKDNFAMTKAFTPVVIDGINTIGAQKYSGTTGLLYENNISIYTQEPRVNLNSTLPISAFDFSGFFIKGIAERLIQKLDDDYHQYVKLKSLIKPFKLK
jgi:hypothetical protein